MTIIRSPYFTPDFPVLSLPDFLLAPAEDSTADFQLSSSTLRRSTPIFYPPPKPLCDEARDKPLSHQDVKDQAWSFAAALLSGKVTGSWDRGDVLVLSSSNQHDYIVPILGTLLAGGIPALCNPSYKPSELNVQLRMVKAKAILASKVSFESCHQAVELSVNAKERGGDFATLKSKPPVWLFEGKSDLKVFDSSNESSSSGTTGGEKGKGLGKMVKEVKELLSKKKEGSEKPEDTTPNERDRAMTLSTMIEIGEKEGPQGLQKVAEVNKKTNPTEDTAILCFSSGTSGLPKAVQLSHYGLTSNIIQAGFLLQERLNTPLTKFMPSSAYSFEPLDKSQPHFHLDLLPTFHCYGLLVQLIALHTLTPRVVIPRFKLDLFLNLVEEHKITFAFVVPPLVHTLVTSKEIEGNEQKLRTLKNVASGAASLSEELRHKLKRRLDIDATDGYGMSEMSPIISLQTLADLKAFPRSVGRLAPGTEAKLFDPDGKELEAGEKTEGELVLRGPQMMKGYLANDSANRSTFVPSPEAESKWLKTGDVARISDEGYITIVDRVKDVIKNKGFQVSPTELENLLYQDDLVHDSAVLGIVSPEDGSEIPWAFIVPNTSTGEFKEPSKDESRAVMERINRQVAGYKKIQGITWIEEIPKSASGKVLKKDLKDKVKL